jgi:nucleoside-diphosphate-sugar epimerase
MLEWLDSFDKKQALPRMLADLTIVQASAAVSLIATFLWQATRLDWEGTITLTRTLESYYAGRFLPLSLVFPLVFLFNGLYTRSRAYVGRYKSLVVLRGSGTALLLFLFLNFLLSRTEIMPRSSILGFGILVSCGTVGARWLKGWFVADAGLARLPGARAFPKEMPVLVVGGAGYIGSLLCRKLLRAGETVRVLDSLVYGDLAIRGLLHRPDFELMVGDCRDIQSVVSAMRGVKSVVHLAAIVGDGACEQDRRTALEVNYAATRMMIEIAKGNGVERFVFASSCSVYGASDLLSDEHSAVNPISLYAQTKVDSEKVLLDARSASFHPVVLRLATVFGDGYRPRFDLVVNLLAAEAYHRGLITIYNGGQWRPFIHVRDVADGILLTLKAPLGLVSGEVFNLGDSRLNHTLTEVGEKIRGVFPEARILKVDNPDRRNYRVSFSRIHDRLGFRCILGLEEGILGLRRSFERNTIPDYTDVRYNNQKFLASAGRGVETNRVQSRVMAAFTGD